MSTVARRDVVFRVTEVAAWTIGLLLLAFYGGTRVRQTVVARREVREFARSKTLSWTSPDQALWSPERIRAWRQSLASGTTAIAVLRIPRIGLEVPVFEGTSDANLDRGAGRIEGTPGPGAPGNVGIAGHRDGFFRVLKDVVTGDAVEVETPTRTIRYVVDSLTLVGPDDVSVLDGTSWRQLTLVTCYPFYYAGSAPQRYILRALENGASQ